MSLYVCGFHLPLSPSHFYLFVQCTAGCVCSAHAAALDSNTRKQEEEEDAQSSLSDDELLDELETDQFVGCRMAQMLESARLLSAAQGVGLGVYSECTGQELLELARKYKNVVCRVSSVFHDTNVDLVLKDLAGEYIATVFRRLQIGEISIVRSAFDGIHSQREGIFCVKDSELVVWEPLVTRLEAEDNLARLCERAHVLERDIGRAEIAHAKSTRLEVPTESDGEEDFNCGLSGCCKRFAHTHIIPGTALVFDSGDVFAQPSNGV
jgi:hypothetical protein